jgi:hypothetical protein
MKIILGLPFLMLLGSGCGPGFGESDSLTASACHKLKVCFVTLHGESLKDIAAAGMLTERVYIDAAEFNEWCQSNNKDNEASVRAEYASVLLHEKYQANSSNEGI